MNNDTRNQIFFPNFSTQPSSPNLLQVWIELSRSAIQANALQFKKWLGPITQISGVIKSNAYGHGIVPIAQLYEECENIASLCVINLLEAVELRQHGIKKPILVIGYLDAFYDLIIEHSIEIVLYDFAIAQQLNKIGQKYNKNIIVHIKFDTGMSRLGITADKLDEFIDQIKTLPCITIKGIFSHFAESYVTTRTHQQEDIFDLATRKNLIVHISNSHGSLTTKYQHYHFARIGIGLYGYLQRHSPDTQNLLQPVLSLKTRILQIKKVVAGSLIGYDSTYQAASDMTIAIIAIGYAEGLDARLSNCGQVIVNGQLAPIIGRVCMNLTIIDISQISHCKTGQIVTILGKEGDISISAYDWSAITKASVYNHLSKLSSTISKIITQ
ncbi:MAG: alanine racemase [Candidatus Dependentiae bacterium]|nr:alanine racemase [Candidatus Dependentiae bacterium]